MSKLHAEKEKEDAPYDKQEARSLFSVARVFLTSANIHNFITELRCEVFDAFPKEVERFISSEDLATQIYLNHFCTNTVTTLGKTSIKHKPFRVHQDSKILREVQHV